jgi:glycosyltransferase involved in cell wall biosynthesis
MQPLVTVAMPVYNGMPYLPKAVESILAQSFEDFECLIANDGSTDASGDYLRSIRDRRVRVIEQSNHGSGPARNRMLAEARGQFFAMMDQDDVSHADRLAHQVQFMQEHPSVGLLGSQVWFVVDEAVVEAPTVPRRHESIRTSLLAGRASMCHSALMGRADKLREVGGYRVCARGLDLDIDLMLRMSEISNLANHDARLHQYRLHLNSVVATRFAEYLVGVRYAIQAAKARNAGVPEPQLDSFVQASLQRGALGRWRDELNAWSTMQYRISVIERCKGRQLRSLLRLSLAAAVRPHSVVRQLLDRS